MTDDSEFADACAHLEQALPVLDKLGLHMAAADVSSALDRMRRSAFGAGRTVQEEEDHSGSD